MVSKYRESFSLFRSFLLIHGIGPIVFHRYNRWVVTTSSISWNLSVHEQSQKTKQQQQRQHDSEFYVCFVISSKYKYNIHSLGKWSKSNESNLILWYHGLRLHSHKNVSLNGFCDVQPQHYLVAVKCHWVGISHSDIAPVLSHVSNFSMYVCSSFIIMQLLDLNRPSCCPQKLVFFHALFVHLSRQ